MITVAVLPSRYYQDIMTIIMSAEASTRWDGKMSGPKHMSQMEAFKSFSLEFWSGWWNLYVTTSKKEQWKTMENGQHVYIYPHVNKHIPHPFPFQRRNSSSKTFCSSGFLLFSGVLALTKSEPYHQWSGLCFPVGQSRLKWISANQHHPLPLLMADLSYITNCISCGIWSSISGWKMLKIWTNLRWITQLKSSDIWKYLPSGKLT